MKHVNMFLVEPNAINYNQLATQNDSTCISQEEYTIDSLNNVVEQATTSLSSLQQAIDTWNTTIDLSAGWNMFGYGCPISIGVVLTTQKTSSSQRIIMVLYTCLNLVLMV